MIHLAIILAHIAVFLALFRLARHRVWRSAPLSRSCRRDSEEFYVAISQGFKPIAEHRKDMIHMELQQGYEVLIDAD